MCERSGAAACHVDLLDAAKDGAERAEGEGYGAPNAGAGAVGPIILAGKDERAPCLQRLGFLPHDLQDCIAGRCAGCEACQIAARAGDCPSRRHRV